MALYSSRQLSRVLLLGFTVVSIFFPINIAQSQANPVLLSIGGSLNCGYATAGVIASFTPGEYTFTPTSVWNCYVSFNNCFSTNWCTTFLNSNTTFCFGPGYDAATSMPSPMATINRNDWNPTLALSHKQISVLTVLSNDTQLSFFVPDYLCSDNFNSLAMCNRLFE